MVTERLNLEKESNLELVHQHLARYEFAKGFVVGKRVLDIACGTGYGPSMMKTGGASTVLGIDVSEESIKYARRNFQSDGLNFIIGDAEDLSKHRGFDVIVSFETIEHLKHYDIFLREVTRSLLSGGLFIVSTPVRERGTINDRPSNPFHLLEWSAEEFKLILNNHFKKVEIQYQYNFKKINWLPYSRTIKRLICRMLYSKQFRFIDSYNVLKQSPKCGCFHFSPAYIIAICS